MKYKSIILILSLLFVTSACDQSDDVIAIFATQGNWKLTSVFYDNGKGTDVCIDYWNNDIESESYKASMEQLKVGANFVLSFSGAEVEHEGIGTYTGRASRNPISGSWTANGKTGALSITNQAAPASNEDILGKVFVNALINAYKYEGDTNGNLRIYFLDKERANNKRFLLFHISQ